MRSEIDHLVVACADLAQGAHWAQQTFGVAPAGGGRHLTMGTHNRLLRLGPRCYLELIAIDPDGTPPGHPRWFDLDNPDLQQRIRQTPELVTWVAATDDLYEAVHKAPMLGEVSDFTRGDYAWRFALTEGGRLNFGGVLPFMIQWNSAHPAEAMDDSGCTLRALRLAHPAANSVLDLFRALRVSGPVELDAGPRRLEALIRTPAGEVTLASPPPAAASA
jgi:hypothetical protein